MVARISPTDTIPYLVFDGYRYFINFSHVYKTERLFSEDELTVTDWLSGLILMAIWLYVKIWGSRLIV